MGVVDPFVYIEMRWYAHLPQMLYIYTFFSSFTFHIWHTFFMNSWIFFIDVPNAEMAPKQSNFSMVSIYRTLTYIYLSLLLLFIISNAVFSQINVTKICPFHTYWIDGCYLFHICVYKFILWFLSIYIDYIRFMTIWCALRWFHMHWA